MVILYGHDTLQDLTFMPSDEQVAAEGSLLGKAKKLRDSKPSCSVPYCSKKPIGYAWKEKEGILDPYCTEHWGIAQGEYYDQAAPW